MKRAAAFSLVFTAALGVAAMVAAQSDVNGPRWWAPGEGRTLPVQLDYANELGVLRTYTPDGPLDTAGHPFFEPFGENDRACVTCHQPADAMSLSAETARRRWDETDGTDPLFAMVDGANCPHLPPEERASHSLLLEHGLFRVERPWPPVDWAGQPVTPDFTLEIVRDPYACNTGAERGPDAGNVSVYRRPRPVANLKYLVAMGFAYDPKSGMPLPVHPDSGAPVSGNFMADRRVPDLRAQMQDAATTHMEMIGAMDEAEKARVEDFILGVFTAQQHSWAGGDLDDSGAEGGPLTLANSEPGQLGTYGRAVWSEFSPWENISDADRARLSNEQIAWRESVARGARIFREKTFLITDSAGINSPIGFGNPVRNSCVFCHNMSQMGNDVAPGQVDLGTTTDPFAEPAPHLPLFRVTCQGEPHPHYGRVIYTTDPGFALTTGHCADVGKITLQSLRGLAARAPYFVNGSAEDLAGVVDYYDRRYNIGYTDEERQDLINLLGAL